MILGAITGLMLGLFLGQWIVKSDFQSAAIKAKVAHYDPVTGDFKYNIMDEDSDIKD